MTSKSATAKATLGKRYTCFRCECKFYDLNKPEPICPKCGADQREDASPDPRVAVMSKYKTTARPQAPKRKEVDDEELDDDLDDDDMDAPDDLEDEGEEEPEVED